MEINTDCKSALVVHEIKILSSSFNRCEENLDSLHANLSISKEIEKLDGMNYKVKLNVSIADSENKLNVKVCCVGTFEISSGSDFLLIEKNAIAIIFPYIRSYVSSITTQPGMQPLILPIVNINNMFKNE